MAALTEAEQASILRHCGYPNWSAMASSFQLGYPAPSDPEYLIRDAFQRITEQGLELVREDLLKCDCTEAQLFKAQERLAAGKVGDITLNPMEINALRQSLTYWRQKLASDLGGYLNPWDQLNNPPVGGINAKVVNG